MNNLRWYTLAVALTLAAVTPLGCAKTNPTSPGGAAGAPVILNYFSDVTISRQVRIWGSVKNQTGVTIYDVRIEMTVYRGDPVFDYFTDTSDVRIAALANDGTSDFGTYQLSGDRLVNAAPLWSYLPPTSVKAAPAAAR